MRNVNLPKLSVFVSTTMTPLVCVIFLWIAGLVHAQSPSNCGPLENHFGPFDFRTANKQLLNLVEGPHFNPGVESLTKRSTSYFADDISYTLRVFPNHHRALITIQRLADREMTDKPEHAQYSIECYFDRAVRFQPSDQIVRMLFAGYLIKKNLLVNAEAQLIEAIMLAPENPFTQFNVGLLFLDMKNYERAVAQAHRAADLGLARTELKERLMAAGKWTEPTAPNGSPKP